MFIVARNSRRGFSNLSRGPVTCLAPFIYVSYDRSTGTRHEQCTEDFIKVSYHSLIGSSIRRPYSKDILMAGHKSAGITQPLGRYWQNNRLMKNCSSYSNIMPTFQLCLQNCLASATSCFLCVCLLDVFKAMLLRRKLPLHYGSCHRQDIANGAE